jgi:starvation-inducible DNA-binding protein
MTDRIPTLDPKVAEDLQATLVDLIDLALQAKQAHWNVAGGNFRSVHLQLDEMMTEYRAWSDVVAERVVAIGVAADGRARTVADSSVLPGFPDGTVGDHTVVELFVERLEATAGAFRERMERLGDTDPVSQDVLIEILAGIEKQLWMVRTQLA